MTSFLPDLNGCVPTSTYFAVGNQRPPRVLVPVFLGRTTTAIPSSTTARVCGLSTWIRPRASTIASGRAVPGSWIRTLGGPVGWSNSESLLFLFPTHFRVATKTTVLRRKGLLLLRSGAESLGHVGHCGADPAGQGVGRCAEPLRGGHPKGELLVVWVTVEQKLSKAKVRPWILENVGFQRQLVELEALQESYRRDGRRSDFKMLREAVRKQGIRPSMPLGDLPPEAREFTRNPQKTSRMVKQPLAIHRSPDFWPPL